MTHDARFAFSSGVLRSEPENSSMSDEEPSVIGAGCGVASMPTDAEHKAVFRSAFVAAFVEMGVPEDTAGRWFDESDWDDLKTGTVSDAVTDITDYWETD
jgi:hypothetical protein